ncbi:hypothetical protein ACFFMN_22740 [Planobispora siamensis]|uniref:Uncharacterized protein n=1 Tax=Planobispora siamensis TaxID=936338 RepID=A0A8J3WS01_9ACTN|nr:hypothetical protein [Planobispora siamensis]GIH97396.1 hypothetical protein Psi01_80260 [Planobispora siamensis]
MISPASATGRDAFEAAAEQWALCAPALSARDRVRLSYDGGRNYPRRLERELTAHLPAHPATVYVYHHGMTSLLVADFDISRAALTGAADPRAAVAADADDFARLVVSCGGSGFGDISPNGGRHCYVPWSSRIYFGPMKLLALALARRYATFDPGPMINITDGLIRPPGSRHRSGGHQLLTTPVEHVRRVLERRNGPEVWSRLLDALQPELESLDLGAAPIGEPAAAYDPVHEPDTTCVPHRDDRSDLPVIPPPVRPSRPAVPAPRSPSAPSRSTRSGTASRAGGSARCGTAPQPDGPGASDAPDDLWLPRAGGPLPRLSPRLEQIARTGRFDSRQYDSPSEARQAVVSGAVACGWCPADLTQRIRSGQWPGLAGFYARYGSSSGIERALRADWKKAVSWIAGREYGREVHTRGRTHGGVGPPPAPRGPRPPAGPEVSDHEVEHLRLIRSWNSARCAAEHHRWTGARSLTLRRVLRAILRAAQQRRSTVVGFGVRNLALLCGLNESTVAKALRTLREESDPFIELVRVHRAEHADTYRLVIPEGYAEAARWRRWQPGRLGGVHPVFRVLGGPAAFVHEQLTVDAPVATFEVQALTGLSATAVSTGLRALAEHGLAERRAGGWVRGPADPDEVARQLGVPELVQEIAARYRRERAEWRTFLSMMRSAGCGQEAVGAHPVPLRQVAEAGPPPWMEAEPHGPPASATDRHPHRPCTATSWGLNGR